MRLAFKPVLLAITCLLLGLGCASPAGDDHPDSEPGAARAPALAPPPAARQELEPEDVLEVIGRASDPGAAIRELDRYPLAFELTAEQQDWFVKRGVSAEIADYLAKRAEVDWEALRGDVDPSSPGVGR